MAQWHVDDRPPRLYTRVYLAGMWARRDKLAFEGAERTRRTARERQSQGDVPPTRWTRWTRSVAASEVAGMRVWSVRPRGAARIGVRVVYLHGGGYVHPLTKDYWRLVRALTRALTRGAADASAEVIVPAYPLAPGATVDDVLPRLVGLVRAVGDDDPGVPVVLMGDSAGGALVLSVAAQLRDGETGRPRPSRLVLLSPWLDATLDEERVADLEASDPMLAESGLRAAGRWWAGRRSPADPLVSPINADLTGLPPADVFVGERDILRPAVDDLVADADRDGLELCVHETTAMFHVWMTRAIPEGARTRRRLRAILASEATGTDA